MHVIINSVKLEGYINKPNNLCISLTFKLLQDLLVTFQLG